MILFILIIHINAQCIHPIFCQGNILHTIQTQKIFNDGKTFVDMTMKKTENEILNAWKNIDIKNKEQVTTFVADNFNEAGSDLESIIPSDYKEKPDYVDNLKVQELKDWSLEINKIWLELCKQFKKDIEEFSSILYVPNPFFVPGGRFREFYYWDTMWVIDGLIISKMFDSAIKMQENFIYIINKLGYIPNGARIYYKGRTQPPVLAQITYNIYQGLIKDGQQERAKQFILKSFEAIEKEFQYFYEHRSIRACLIFQNVYCDVMLYHYDSDIYYPRPESYNEDISIGHANIHMYHEITAGAESGWDFSTRWFADQKSLESIQTSDILSVDLNTFMIINMKRLASFSKILGYQAKQTFYETLSKNTEEILLDKFYNKETYQWNDYNFRQKSFNKNFYASNYFPLILKSKSDSKLIDNLKQMIQQYPGGIPTSIFNTGQQWDLPNSWPPLNQMIIQGLINNDQMELALQLSQNVINNAYCCFEKSIIQYGKGYMFEKYDATSIGTSGGGGEYEVQTGFGWTNGVVIWILNTFGQKLVLPTCPQQI
ncbi:unnamed protein product [Paramecium primaurelia]|uniref:Alpha,alpha-trehalose glucohydrolase n=1 Tax=Paramecium primaurelia TaxID=5886 RepID=A0A8S1NRA9_PARPR|nr:unnamed protein product [Paramecium primaurelia]